MSSPLPTLRRAALGALLGAAAVLGAACSDETTAPLAPDASIVAPSQASAAAAGRYAVRLTTPNEGDEAALLVITGAAVDSVSVPDGSAIVLSGDVGTRVILSGTLRSGTVATLWTRPASGVPSAVVEQVTAAGTHAQRALQGYRVELAR